MRGARVDTRARENLSKYLQPSSRKRHILLCVLFALGLLSKPMLVTIPFVMLLLDIWPLKRLNLEPKSLGTMQELLKGNSKEHYHLDALTRDARDDWVAVFEALRFNCIIAALQRNDSAVTTVFQFESDAESCSA